jgi:hypothetical protein
MLDPHSLADYSAHLLENFAEDKLEHTLANSDLAQRLGLYRVFLKLYEHHRTLLNDILDLENTTERSRLFGSIQFVQGMIHGSQVSLISNLAQGQTVSLLQPQHIWLIGRDSHAAICVHDSRISRRHAVVQYVETEGFYLVDLNSTNGTYVNGEPIRKSALLQDGDQVRLGRLAFTFFLSQAFQTDCPERSTYHNSSDSWSDSSSAI